VSSPLAGRRLRTASQVALLVAGLLIMLYPVTLGPGTPPTCRQQVMRSGDVCVKADGSESQSFEQRTEAAANTQPVILVVGAAVAAFAGYLLWSGRASSPTSKTQAP
jgi:hypothetical protein